MIVLTAALFYFPDVAFARYAKQALAQVCEAGQAASIWEETRIIKKELRAKRPHHSPGVNLILRYLEWDVALYRAASGKGISEADTKRLIEEINWMAFGPAITLSFKLSRLRSANRLRRVQWLVDLMFAVLFTRPFRRKKFPLTQEVAFDVTACPLAKYFQDQGLASLTAAAVCNLDYQMATAWGVTLHRTQTIAQGNEICDFRFRQRTSEGNTT